MILFHYLKKVFSGKTFFNAFAILSIIILKAYNILIVSKDSSIVCGSYLFFCWGFERVFNYPIMNNDLILLFVIYVFLLSIIFVLILNIFFRIRMWYIAWFVLWFYLYYFLIHNFDSNKLGL